MVLADDGDIFKFLPQNKGYVTNYDSDFKSLPVSWWHNILHVYALSAGADRLDFHPLPVCYPVMIFGLSMSMRHSRPPRARKSYVTV